MISDIQNRIVEEAWSWNGTPYHDHAGIKKIGVDCAYFPLRVYQSVGLIPRDFKPPKYSPQKWLNSPQQTDKLKLKIEDTTFLEIVLQFARYELRSKETPNPPQIRVIDSEPQPGDFVIYKVAASWTHGGIIIDWPETVLHPIVDRGVIGSHGTKEGFLLWRPHRFFRVIEETDGSI